MSYSMTAAAEQYRTVGLRHEVDSASPHRLIQLLMERFLMKVNLAARLMQDVTGGKRSGEPNPGENPIAEKGSAISDAISILNGLQVSLNHEPNATLSGNFDALYDYMTRRLLESNLQNDVSGLNEVADLMREIKSAWDLIGDQVGTAPEPA